MQRIKGSLTQDLERHVGTDPVGRVEAYPVGSFRELVELVAHLSYLNKDHLLFFRGQPRDYTNKAGTSTIYPPIYRGERVPREQLDFSFSLLKSCAAQLCDALRAEGISSHRDVRRRKYVQWSILQHYQVCPTPLLDLTHSLRVACSFAFLSVKESDPFVFVFGMPYVMNRISVNSEHDVVNIRLLSISPPEALRPHFQEGYLAGSDDILMEFEDKSELDFNNRLIAKFRLTGRARFWNRGFRAYPEKVLYPSGDRMEAICNQIKQTILTTTPEGWIGSFLAQWVQVERLLIDRAAEFSDRQRVHSVRGALDILRHVEVLPEDLWKHLHQLRKLRNKVVHRPGEAPPRVVSEATSRLKGFQLDLDRAFEKR